MYLYLLLALIFSIPHVLCSKYPFSDTCEVAFSVLFAKNIGYRINEHRIIKSLVSKANTSQERTMIRQAIRKNILIGVGEFLASLAGTLLGSLLMYWIDRAYIFRKAHYLITPAPKQHPSL